MRSLCLYVLLAALWLVSSAPTATTQYTLFSNKNIVAVILRGESGESNAQITTTRHSNYSDVAYKFFRQKRMEPGARTIQSIEMLLELASGGECDSCKTFVEEATLRLIDLQERKTKEAMDNARARGVDFKELVGMQMDQNAVEKEFGNLCQSDRYRRYALHVQMGCQELIRGRGFLEMLHQMANSTTPPERRIPEFKKILCQKEPAEGKNAPCAARAVPPAHIEWDSCRQCGENVQDLIYLLKRTSRAGIQKAGTSLLLQSQFVVTCSLRR